MKVKVHIQAVRYLSRLVLLARSEQPAIQFLKTDDVRAVERYNLRNSLGRGDSITADAAMHIVGHDGKTDRHGLGKAASGRICHGSWTRRSASKRDIVYFNYNCFTKAAPLGRNEKVLEKNIIDACRCLQLAVVAAINAGELLTFEALKKNSGDLAAYVGRHYASRTISFRHWPSLNRLFHTRDADPYIGRRLSVWRSARSRIRQPVFDVGLDPGFSVCASSPRRMDPKKIRKTVKEV